MLLSLSARALWVPRRSHASGHIKRQGRPISISVYKHCFLEEPRVRRLHASGASERHAPSFSRSPSCTSPPPCPSPSPASCCRSRWADTSCMSPSCKRGVTRLTSIVLVDGHAYRAMDRWAGDDKGTARGHRDGHAPRCPGSHRRYHRLPRNNARPWLGLRDTQLALLSLSRLVFSSLRENRESANCTRQISPKDAAAAIAEGRMKERHKTDSAKWRFWNQLEMRMIEKRVIHNTSCYL